MLARTTAAQLEQRRRAVVHSVETGESTLASVCDKYGISRRTFYRWKREVGIGRATLAERLQCVEDVQSGRVSVRHACRERGISVRTYYRWSSQKGHMHHLLVGAATLQPPQTVSNHLNVPEQPRDDASERDDIMPERAPFHPDVIKNGRQLPSAKPTTPIPSIFSIASLPNASRESTQPSQAPNRFPPDDQLAQPLLNAQDAQMINANERAQLPFHTPVSSDLASELSAPSLPSAAQQSPPLAHDPHQSSKQALPAKPTEASAPHPAASTPLQAAGHPTGRASSTPVSSANGGAEATPPTSSTGIVLPPRARRNLRRPQAYRDSPSSSELSVDDAAVAEDPPDKHRIIVCYNDTQASLVWYAGATAGDIKAAIARRFCLPPGTFFTLRDDVDHEVTVSEGLPSGIYDLLV